MLRPRSTLLLSMSNDDEPFDAIRLMNQSDLLQIEPHDAYLESGLNSGSGALPGDFMINLDASDDFESQDV